MARDVATMSDELRAMAGRHAELHADRARLLAGLHMVSLHHLPTSLLAFNRARRRRCRSRRLSAVSFSRPACRRACAQAALRGRSAVARSSSVGNLATFRRI